MNQLEGYAATGALAVALIIGTGFYFGYQQLSSVSLVPVAHAAGGRGN